MSWAVGSYKGLCSDILDLRIDYRIPQSVICAGLASPHNSVDGQGKRLCNTKETRWFISRATAACYALRIALLETFAVPLGGLGNHFQVQVSSRSSGGMWPRHRSLFGR